MVIGWKIGTSQISKDSEDDPMFREIPVLARVA
jgi:hypothetical protein